MSTPSFRPTERELYGFIWDDPNPDAPDEFQEKSMWSDPDLLRDLADEEEK